MRAGLAALAVALAASGCGAKSDPQSLADDTTQGIYNADLARTTAHFDDALKSQVTRASIGDLADKMHALGTYHGLKAVQSEPDKGRYDYDAAFDKGTMRIQLRLDPNQKIGAYRVVPVVGSAPQPSTS
ncbi:MAG TPA: hypothetical protein VMA36_11680 [Candidatus Limnocylindria bacterium]|nr:hypothetical protein [Candidatus Limnocylindria bacterium]